MIQKQNDQAYVEFTAKILAKYPDEVRVEREISERGVLIKLFVHPDDLGAIIGKGGATVTAIRQILRTIGLKNNSWVALKVDQTFARPIERVSVISNRDPVDILGV